jgi:Carboxypeptidase regulatory-like domain
MTPERKNMALFSRSWTSVALIILTCHLLPDLRAQGEAVTATLSGTVLDASRAGVPLARITLDDPKAGFARQLVSSADGRYVFTSIPPGRYQLEVEKEGFAKYVHPDVVLTVAQSTTLNPELQAGDLSVVIEVIGGAPVLNTGNANIGAEVTGEQVVDLPLNIRNVYNLVQLSSATNNSTEVQGLT